MKHSIVWSVRKECHDRSWAERVIEDFPASIICARKQLSVSSDRDAQKRRHRSCFRVVTHGDALRLCRMKEKENSPLVLFVQHFFAREWCSGLGIDSLACVVYHREGSSTKLYRQHL